MSKDCDTQYKMSRNNAGLTQEEAAEMLGEATGRPLPSAPCQTMLSLADKFCGLT